MSTAYFAHTWSIGPTTRNAPPIPSVTQIDMFAFLWAALMFFMAFSFWKAAGSHSRDSLGMSTASSLRDSAWSRLMRKMSGTVTVLCLASALAGWFGAWTLAILLVLAIPAAGAITFVRTKSALADNYRRSLPPS